MTLFISLTRNELNSESNSLSINFKFFTLDLLSTYLSLRMEFMHFCKGGRVQDSINTKHSCSYHTFRDDFYNHLHLDCEQYDKIFKFSSTAFSQFICLYFKFISVWNINQKFWTLHQNSIKTTIFSSVMTGYEF